MAATVTDRFREIVYSGDAKYTADLTINGTKISPQQIKSIKISNPIIDNNQNTFYIGTFISQKVDITFRNIEELDIQTGYEVDLSISLLVDNIQENLQIGKYIVDTLAENYQKTNQITCLDYAIKFTPAVDYSVAFDEEGKITLENLLIWLCQHYGVELGTYPTINNDVTTGAFDNTVSGKRYISYIAEMFGGNAKIDRDGTLNIIPLKREPDVEINALRSKSFTLGEKYKISQVTYFDAKRNFTSGTDENNILIIRQENIFVTSQENINNIYNQINGFECYTLTNENYGDISLDAWDLIQFNLNDKSYVTLNNSELTYEINISTKINTTIPTKQQEITTNTKGQSAIEIAKYAKTTVDNLNATVETITKEVSSLNENNKEIVSKFGDYALKTDVTNLETNVRDYQTSTYKKTEINQILKGEFYDENNNQIVTEIVRTTSGTFDEDGMHYEKTGAKTKSTINEKGLQVDDDNNNELLFAGYDENKNQTIVRTDNLTVRKHFIIDDKSRFQSYETGTGVFWIGD